jgi:hypothetical protein
MSELSRMSPCLLCRGGSLRIPAHKGYWGICMRCKVRWWAGLYIASDPRLDEYWYWKQPEFGPEDGIEIPGKYTPLGRDQ